MKHSLPYQTLCSQYYDLDKPSAPKDALLYYLSLAREANGPILEPMCGTGRFLIPLAKAGFQITGFDSSTQMLDICRNKCQKQNIHPLLFTSSFETFYPTSSYYLIFIPSGSFCLLTSPKKISEALNLIYKCLENNGKFILEIETHTQKNRVDSWKAKWVKKPDGSLIVLNYTKQFHENLSVETTLCRYEHWSKHKIIQTEVEEFCLRLYHVKEIEDLLQKHGFQIEKRLQPYTSHDIKENDEVILYECTKKKLL